MLSRTADNIYWLSRNMERAENLARIIEAAIREHGSKRKAAAALGVDIGTIVRKTNKGGRSPDGEH